VEPLTCSVSRWLFTEWWDLENPDEKHDTIPEIWEGRNIADYIDPQIFNKLEELEKEEELREQAGFYDDDDVSAGLTAT